MKRNIEKTLNEFEKLSTTKDNKDRFKLTAAEYKELMETLRDRKPFGFTSDDFETLDLGIRFGVVVGWKAAKREEAKRRKKNSGK